MTEAVNDPTTVVVNRWRRYGKDRLYVMHADESKIGWWDLTTDEGHPESPEDLAALTAAVERWKAENLAPSGTAAATAATESAAETVPQPVETLTEPSVPSAPLVAGQVPGSGVALRSFLGFRR